MIRSGTLFSASVAMAMSASPERQLGDLARAALVQYQMHLGVGQLEIADHFRQRIAGLGVGGGNRQLAGVLAGELLGDAADVLRVEQHPFHYFQQFLAGLGHAEQALALAHENLNAQLVLKILDALADAGLRGVDGFRHLGQVEALTDGFADDA